MGNLFSRPPASQTYERILSDIDEKIRNEEAFLIDLRLNDRRYSVLLLLYGLMIYGALLAWIFMYPRDQRTAWDVAMVLGYPVFLYQVRRLLGALYARRIGAGEERLKLLRERQRMKVEELKKMTDYYTTKGLLDRFDPDTTPKHERNRKTTTGLQDTVAVVERERGVVTRTQVPKPTLSPSPQVVSTTNASPPYAPSWFDRLVDAVIGDERGSKYALICPRCHAHNGLVREHELATIRYLCPNCHFPVGMPEAKSEGSLKSDVKSDGSCKSDGVESIVVGGLGKSESLTSLKEKREEEAAPSFVSTTTSPSHETTPTPKRRGGRRTSATNSPLGK